MDIHPNFLMRKERKEGGEEVRRDGDGEKQRGREREEGEREKCISVTDRQKICLSDFQLQTAELTLALAVTL